MLKTKKTNLKNIILLYFQLNFFFTKASYTVLLSKHFVHEGGLEAKRNLRVSKSKVLKNKNRVGGSLM